MVLKRDAASLREFRESAKLAKGADQSEPEMNREETWTQVRRPSLQGELGPNELRRITDQVVSSLDRRVFAIRERLGRV